MSKQNIGQQFLKAVKRNDINLIQLVISNKNINPTNSYNSALKIATERGYSEILILLLEQENICRQIPESFLYRFLNLSFDSLNYEIIKAYLTSKHINLNHYNYIYEAISNLINDFNSSNQEISEKYYKIFSLLIEHEYINNIFKSEFNNKYEELIIRKNMNKNIISF